MTAKTILLIEDNYDILENLTEYFEMESYYILAAHDGKHGIELACEYIPDLIICDMYMPVMDGKEVLRLLLLTSKTSGIPFIFSTSIPYTENRTTALKYGADDYIVKPFEMETLLFMAQSWIKSGKNYN